MKHTSFELAKQIYDKGIRIDTEYWVNKSCAKIHKDVILIHPEYKEGSYPSPTLDELLDWLPANLKIGGAIHTLHLSKVAYKQDPKQVIYGVYYRHYNEKVREFMIPAEFLYDTRTNICDACAELALWLIKNDLVAQNELQLKSDGASDGAKDGV